jgi:cytochrome c oxidase cbb3-type subunit 3
MNDTDAREPEHLLEHEYDGIREYDNPLPRWWVWLFVVTVVFSAGYYGWNQLGPGPTVIAQYEAEVREAAEHRAPAGAVAGSEEALRRLQADATVMARARETFATRCAACHGPEGQGVIGPNLADEFWLHGGTLTAILHTVAEGVPDKGMVPWKHQLAPAELEALAAYIGTLAGTNPPNPKLPQGMKATGA